MTWGALDWHDDGATGEIRTPGLLITNQTLYQSKLQWQRRGHLGDSDKRIGVLGYFTFSRSTISPILLPTSVRM